MMIRKIMFLLGAAFAVAVAPGAWAFNPPPFPRLAGINYGAPQSYNDPKYQASLAKLSLTVLSMWPGYKPGGESMDQAVKAIKALNPNELVFMYVQMDSRDNIGGVWSSYLNKINSMNWWLYTNGTSGQQVPSTYGNGFNTINTTLFTPKDSSGEDAIDWITNFFMTNYYDAAPSVDGFFMDNVFVRPNIDGDWNRDGRTDSQTDPQVGTWFRQGYAHYFSLVRQLMPGKYQLGNIGDWGVASASYPEYTNMVDGGLLEAYIGKSWSYETWAGWQTMINQYHKVMGAVTGPKLLIFGQWGSPTDYQGMRYGLTSCLMDDGYFSYTDTAHGYGSVPWFDEFDVKLGPAVTGAPTAPWQHGVYRRDFENGIALVNPKGNGTQTVTLETSFVKIKGSQAPAVNDGSTVTKVTLRDRDGIILLRRPPPNAPQPPAGVTAGK